MKEKEVSSVDLFLLSNTNYTGLLTKSTGVIYHIKEGKIHNEDGPAITNGSYKLELYYINGKRMEKTQWERIAKIKKLLDTE